MKRFLSQKLCKESQGVVFLYIAIIVSIISASMFSNNYITSISLVEFGVVFCGKPHVMTLLNWINNGLMSVFFFVLGLEVKKYFFSMKAHERLTNLLVIVFVTAGGVVAPAMIYVFFNYGKEGIGGWIIPITTDTAFSIGLLALFAKELCPKSVALFSTIAAFDDIAAIFLVSIFFTSNIQIEFLMGILAALLLAAFVNIANIKNGFIYAAIGFFLWFFTYKSGIHCTISGLFLAFAVPIKVYNNPKNIYKNKEKLVVLDDIIFDKNIFFNNSQCELLEAKQKELNLILTPLQRWSRLFDYPVSIFIVPLFVLFNTNISLSLSSLALSLKSPVTLGTIVGLLIGKPLGICCSAFLVKILYSTNNVLNAICIKNFLLVGMVSSVGLTMSMFMSNIAFSFNSELNEFAKTGSLIALLLSIIILILTKVILWFTSLNRQTVWIDPGLPDTNLLN